MSDVGAIGQRWLDWCVAEGVSPHTVKRRRSVLRSVGDAGGATRDEIEDWWASRRDRKPSTRANDLACLRSFYRWAQKWEWRADDPSVRLDAPKVPKGQPRPLGTHEIRQLLEAGTPEVRRAVALGALAGLRVSEAAAADWSNVDLEAKRIRVTGKGQKTRLVALSDEILEILGKPHPSGSIVTGGHRPYNADALQRLVNRTFKRLGIVGTFHQLRHRYGTAGFQATHDLVAVGRQMGHTSPTTTAIYSAAADETADVIAEAVAKHLALAGAVAATETLTPP